jgi:gliding motility-associated-like protein
MRFITTIFFISFIFNGLKAQVYLDTFVDNSAICMGSEIEVKFSTNFVSAEYTVQLSDDKGSFDKAPLSIGRISNAIGRTGGGTKAVIPALILPSNKYRIRMIATAPFFAAGDNGVDIIIKPAPAVKVEVIGSPFLCGGNEFVTLKAVTNTTTNIYEWTSGETTQSITVSRAGTYAVKVRDRQTECEVNSNAIEVTANEMKKPDIQSNGSLALCEGSYIELRTPFIEGINYEWQKNGKREGTVNSNALVVTQAGEYQVTIINKCAKATSLPILVSLKAIVPPPTCAPTSRCGEGKAILKASGGKEGKYQWYDENFYPIRGANSSTYITDHLKRKGTYYVANEEFGCVSAKVQADVFIRPPAIPVYAGEDVAIILGESVQLNALLRNNLPTSSEGIEAVASSSKTNYRYEWSPKDYLDNPYIPNPVATPPENMVYTVTTIIEEGCEVADNVKVTVRRALKIPNGFTPNGDGVNDTWEIANIAFQPDAVVEIFDRWGSKVFESKGYSTNWDGTSNGQPLPTHTYFYVISAENGKLRWAGAVNLVR